MKAWIVAAATGLVLAAGAAQARDVTWSVTVGSPQPVFAPPRVIYAPPPVVYHPAPVVYAPPPVVYRAVPVVYQPVPVYYGPPGHAKHWHKKHHRHHGWEGRGYEYGYR